MASVADLTPEHPRGSMHSGNVADELAHGQVNLDVVLVSPERPLFEGAAHWVTATGSDGQFGVWPRHAHTVVALGSGPLRIGQRGGAVTLYLTHGGFLEVSHNHVTILVDAALSEAETPATVEAATRELAETNAELQHPRSDAEFRELMDLRDWSQARIALGTKQ